MLCALWEHLLTVELTITILARSRFLPNLMPTAKKVGMKADILILVKLVCFARHVHLKTNSFQTNAQRTITLAITKKNGNQQWRFLILTRTKKSVG